MRHQDLVLGDYYRLKSTPNYSYIKPLEILKPKQGMNPHNYIIVKCMHVLSKWEKSGYTRYFRPRDIIKENTK